MLTHLVELARIGRIIRRIRLSSRLTQADFAQRMGVTQSVVSRWESGTRRPNRCAFERIAAMGKREEEAATLIEAAKDARPPRSHFATQSLPHNVSIAPASEGVNVRM